MCKKCNSLSFSLFVIDIWQPEIMIWLRFATNCVNQLILGKFLRGPVYRWQRLAIWQTRNEAWLLLNVFLLAASDLVRNFNVHSIKNGSHALCLVTFWLRKWSVTATTNIHYLATGSDNLFLKNELHVFLNQCFTDFHYNLNQMGFYSLDSSSQDSCLISVNALYGSSSSDQVVI